MQMRHPDNPNNIVEVSERAFEYVWEKKGWVAVSSFVVEEPPTIQPPDDIEDVEGEDVEDADLESEPIDTDPEATRIPVLENMTDAALREVAADLGIEGHDQLTANELRSLVSNTPEFYA